MSAGTLRVVRRKVARRVAVRRSTAPRRPEAPRLRRFGRTDSGTAPARRRACGSGDTVWANANKASREPFTGSTWVAGSRQGCRSGVPASRRCGRAILRCRRWPDRRPDPARVSISACSMKSGVGCFGSPMPRLIGESGRIRALSRQKAGAIFRTDKNAVWQERDSRNGRG